MAKQYMSVRAVAAAAGVSVQAVYKWIEKGELKAEVVRISEVEKRYRVTREAARRVLQPRARAPKKSAPRKVAAKTGVRPKDKVKEPMTGRAILESGLVGLWADRDDIGDNLEFARELRRRASTRHHEVDVKGLLSKALRKPETKPKTRAGKKLVKDLRRSGLIGMWKDRDDIGDSLEFARKLRKQASTRHRD
jgi:hypothetical protein